VQSFPFQGFQVRQIKWLVAEIEGSKAFAKKLMEEADIPTAKYKEFNNYQTAIDDIKKSNVYPIVIKADGLAAGKGVVIANQFDQAEEALKNCFVNQKFGDAGQTVIIEEFMAGVEASLMAFIDGKTIKMMASAKDHKKLLNDDKGPNTGGMGAYSPTKNVTPEVEKQVLDIMQKIIDALSNKGVTYKGILYAGLMIKDNQAKIVEFNVRFGDPETQAVLIRLRSDLVDILEAIVNQTLDTLEIRWHAEHACCVVLASEGYPNQYKKGVEITDIDHLENSRNWLIHSGTAIKNKKLVTNGGRVFGFTSKAPTVHQAAKNIYNALEWIQYSGKYYRTDIGLNN